MLDPNATGRIHIDDIPKLLENLGRPFGWKEMYNNDPGYKKLFADAVTTNLERSEKFPDFVNFKTGI
jgi:hypothetical protein